MNDIEVTWEEARNSADKLFSMYINPNILDETKYVHDNYLPFLISKIFEVAYVENIDRTSEDMQVLFKAYDQLHRKGYI